MGITPAVSKVASGAAESTPYLMVTNLARTLAELKERNIWIVGADERAEKTLYEADLPESIAWVLGAEGEGMRRLTRRAATCWCASRCAARSRASTCRCRRESVCTNQRVVVGALERDLARASAPRASTLLDPRPRGRRSGRAVAKSDLARAAADRSRPRARSRPDLAEPGTAVIDGVDPPRASRSTCGAGRQVAARTSAALGDRVLLQDRPAVDHPRLDRQRIPRPWRLTNRSWESDRFDRVWAWRGKRSGKAHDTGVGNPAPNPLSNER